MLRLLSRIQLNKVHRVTLNVNPMKDRLMFQSKRLFAKINGGSLAHDLHDYNDTEINVWCKRIDDDTMSPVEICKIMISSYAR